VRQRILTAGLLLRDQGDTPPSLALSTEYTNNRERAVGVSRQVSGGDARCLSSVGRTTSRHPRDSWRAASEPIAYDNLTVLHRSETASLQTQKQTHPLSRRSVFARAELLPPLEPCICSEALLWRTPTLGYPGKAGTGLPRAAESR
jgi:hypothetical protein